MGDEFGSFKFGIERISDNAIEIEMQSGWQEGHILLTTTFNLQISWKAWYGSYPYIDKGPQQMESLGDYHQFLGDEIICQMFKVPETGGINTKLKLSAGKMAIFQDTEQKWGRLQMMDTLLSYHFPLQKIYLLLLTTSSPTSLIALTSPCTIPDPVPRLQTALMNSPSSPFE